MPIVKPKDMKGRKREGGGRNSRGDIDWELAEQFFVQGEIIVEKSKSGDLIRKKPSFSDVGRRFKCTASTVAYQAKKCGWTAKRHTWERMASQSVAEEVAKARALSFAEGAAILDRWFLKFNDALERDNVRTDSLSDFNTALRLKSFIEAQGSAAADTKSNAVTLEDLQRNHRRMRDKAAALNPAVTGVIEEKPPGEGTD